MITRSIKVKEEQYLKLKEIAKKEDRSVSWIIRKAIDEYIDEKG